MFPRGALICFEGLDRSGKTTQAQLLFEHLRKHGRVELWRFPDRQTPIGALIQRYLQKGENHDDRVVHLLFSANRWEKMHDMMDKLKAGTTILVDRYAYSGAAYTAAKNIVNAPLAWCQGADIGLISPDLVIFLELSAAGATGRAGYGIERYENPQFQEQVRQQYAALAEQNPTCWVTLSADENSDLVATKVQQLVEATLDNVRRGGRVLGTL